MRHLLRCFFVFPLLLALTACNGMPKLFWDVDEGRGDPAYTRGSGASQEAKPRPPLEVPPELREEIELPKGEDVADAGNSGKLSADYRQAVAGKAVALHARLYNVQTEQLFSAVVDAMTALNLPVGSVDSPSGIITTDWIRKNTAKSATSGNMLSSLLGGSASDMYRYRFIIRVFRAGQASESRLEVRVLSQVYENRHWVNKPAHEKRSEELFAAIEKQLGRTEDQQPPPSAPAQTE